MFQAFEQLLIEQSILAVSVDTETTWIAFQRSDQRYDGNFFLMLANS
jgi:hypothetical protein